MTQLELNAINRWLIYRADYKGMPILYWPEKSEELGVYAVAARPPKPDDMPDAFPTEAYCWQNQTFWFGDWKAEYFGPEDILENLQTLWLMESL